MTRRPHAAIIAAIVALSAALPLSAAVAGARVYTDAEILGVVAAANQGAMDAAALAVGKSQIRAVKKLAKLMRKDHGSIKNRLIDAEARTGLAPIDTDLSLSLAKHATEENAQLGYLKGDEFDGPYVDAQVSDHETLIRVIDLDLLPSAKDASVASLLRKLRSTDAHHLAMARDLEKKFVRPKR
ncbi:MAG: DUF4142 domain-containing protein [Elusimicrobiota bacterium]